MEGELSEMQRKIKVRIGVGLGSLFAILAVAGWLYWLRPPQLLEKARLVCSTEGWNQGRRFYNGIGFYWLSDRSILHDLFEGAKQERHIYRKDIVTGQDTLLPGLTASREQFSTEVVDDQQVSPDGNWYLCSNRWGDCLLTSIEGTGHRVYPSKDDAAYRGFHWTPDSRHWIESYGEGGTIKHLILHDVRKPAFSQELTFDKDHVPDIFLTTDRGVYIDWPQETMDVAGKLLLDKEAVGKLKEVTISTEALQDADKLFATHTLRIPTEVKYLYFKLSPDLIHVAWLVTWQRSNSYLEWLHKYISGIKPMTVQGTSLWVSDLDGRKAHEVGRIEKAIDPSEEEETLSTYRSTYRVPDPLIDEFMWLPSGKAISFTYQKKLYTVPAE